VAVPRFLGGELLAGMAVVSRLWLCVTPPQIYRFLRDPRPPAAMTLLGKGGVGAAVWIGSAGRFHPHPSPLPRERGLVVGGVTSELGTRVSSLQWGRNILK